MSSIDSKTIKSRPLHAKGEYLYTPKGDDVYYSLKKEYNPETQRDEIVKKSKISITEELQRSSNSYDLALLKKKYKMTGELPPDVGGYGDTDIDLTIFPDDIHGLYKARNQLQDKFNQLDPKLIAAYGSFENFVSSVYRGQVPESVQEYYQNKKNIEDLENLKKEIKGENA